MKQKTYTQEEYNSNSGMLTSVWGPSLWHFLHTVSFNYPVKPTKKDKEKYKEFVESEDYQNTATRLKEIKELKEDISLFLSQQGIVLSRF